MSAVAAQIPSVIRKNLLRVISARPMSRRERKTYALD
jgi:uncharacterized DUF497 family protein